MKKVLSIIVMVLCAIASLFVIGLAAILIISLIELIYDKSRALFWVILLCGGSFGLWIFWSIIPITADLTVRPSQKISLSKKGLRYTVMGIAIIVLYGIGLIQKIADPSRYELVSAIFSYILFVFYSVVLIAHGRETAQLEYVAPATPIIAQATEISVNADSIPAYAKPTNTNEDPAHQIPAESLKVLKELHDTGVLSEEEFAEKKRQLLGL